MKKILLTTILICCCWAQVSVAETYKIAVNQFVEHPSLDAVLLGFQDYLKENKIDIEYSIHIAQANMGTASQIAKQMIGEEPDLFLSITTPSSQACAQALARAPKAMKRPLLFSAVTNPVEAGLVKDLNNPQNNITGVSDLLPIEDHIKMVLQYVPTTKTIGVLYNGGEANSKSTVADLKKVAKQLNIKVVEATASKTADVYQAAKSLVGRVDVIFIPTDNTIIASLESVLKVGIQNKLPVFSADVESVKRGSVAAMGFDYYKHGYQAGAIAARILAGEATVNIPVEFQHDLQLHINKSASEAMGVTPPQALLKIASNVIE